VSSERTKRTKRQQSVDELVVAVNSLAAIQAEILVVKRQKLEMKRAEMYKKGFWQVENGSWGWSVNNSTNSTEE